MNYSLPMPLEGDCAHLLILDLHYSDAPPETIYFSSSDEHLAQKEWDHHHHYLKKAKGTLLRWNLMWMKFDRLTMIGIQSKGTLVDFSFGFGEQACNYGGVVINGTLET